MKTFYFPPVGGLTEVPYQLAVGKVRQDGRLIEDLWLSREQDCAGALIRIPNLLLTFLYSLLI